VNYEDKQGRERLEGGSPMAKRGMPLDLIRGVDTGSREENASKQKISADSIRTDHAPGSQNAITFIESGR
jgi:hypothetical protein